MCVRARYLMVFYLLPILSLHPAELTLLTIRTILHDCTPHISYTHHAASDLSMDLKFIHFPSLLYSVTENRT